jgi:hypothetical protein
MAKQLTTIKEGGKSSKTYSEKIKNIAQSGIPDTIYSNQDIAYVKNDTAYGIGESSGVMEAIGAIDVDKSKLINTGNTNEYTTPDGMNFENSSGVLKEIPSYNTIQAQKEVEAKAKYQENNPGINFME